LEHYRERPWAAVATATQSGRAIHVALTVGRRLRDLPTHSRITDAWHPVSLAEGDVGLALLCGQIGDYDNDMAWQSAAHRFLQQAALAAAHEPVPAGLFVGLAGLGFVASSLSHNGIRYRRLLNSIDRALIHRLGADQLDRTVDGFDVVFGLTGLGVYFLQRAHTPAGRKALHSVIDLLVGDSSVPTPRQWSTPVSTMTGPMREMFPGGYIDCGLAHGVPGPLAFLARSRLRGVRDQRLDTVIEQAATWLALQRRDDSWGPDWPPGIPLDALAAGTAHSHSRSVPTRAAWCYGSPGVARALWRSGVALDRAEWRDLAVEAMHAVYRRPADLRRVTSPGLCHGLAGLLHITLCFYHDTGDDEFARQARDLINQLLEQFDPESCYGFPFHERGNEIDSGGFLEGATGVAVTLLAAASDQAPTWDELMLIA
jgi:hypothetical protein